MLGSLVAGPNLLVIGVEQRIIAGMVLLVVFGKRFEDEGFEEPGGMRQMPFGRARVGHRLDALILGD